MQVPTRGWHPKSSNPPNFLKRAMFGGRKRNFCILTNRIVPLFSFGVVLWEILTGEKPYSGLNMFVVAYGVGHGTLTLPIPEDCPQSLKQLMNCKQYNYD